MRVSDILALGAAVAMSAGCAIHPLPEDVTRNSTYYIVQKIRCEARDAIRAHAVDPQKRGALDQTLARLETRGVATNDDLRAIEAALKNELSDAVIGYGFNFTITEGDSGSGSAAFALPFSNGRFSLSVGLGEDKERKSERNFILTERFVEILADVEIKDCTKSEDWKYPINGQIGLSEVVETYIKISGLGSNFYRASKDIGNFVDTLSFTTTYSSSVNPRIDLNPVANDFRLTQATASLGADRKDVHKVSIVLTKGGLGGGASTARGYAAERAEFGESGRDAAKDILLREQTKGVLNDILENVQ